MREFEDLRALSDEELIQRYQQMKTEGSGDDPRLVPPVNRSGDELEQELERRGLAPDREDLIPTIDDDDEEPTVRDTA
jgi:cobalamin biosynthesis protein CbiG